MPLAEVDWPPSCVLLKVIWTSADDPLVSTLMSSQYRTTIVTAGAAPRIRLQYFPAGAIDNGDELGGRGRHISGMMEEFHLRFGEGTDLRVIRSEEAYRGACSYGDFDVKYDYSGGKHCRKRDQFSREAKNAPDIDVDWVDGHQVK